MLSDAAYNGFAAVLADRIAARAIGVDDDSLLIPGMRPSDQILGGFLTPARSRAGEDEEDAEREELPNDSPYEQSTCGVEFLVRNGALAAISPLRVRLSLYLFVRRLPSFTQQKSITPWSILETGGVPEAPGRSPLAAVWTREGPFPLTLDLPGDELLSRGRIRRSLDPRIAGVTKNSSGYRWSIPGSAAVVRHRGGPAIR